MTEDGIRSILLTGASGGLGRALVRDLAREGRAMMLCGRNLPSLEAAASDARARGAMPEICSQSLRDTPRFLERALAFDDRTPIDLLILNAGVKTGNSTGIEAAPDPDRTFEVNLRSPIQTIQALLPRMTTRRRGRIVLVSSMAALSPHPDLLSYSATKAAVRAYGIALERCLAGTGVSVTVVTPGFVDTPMTDRHLGPTPLKISAGQASSIICRGLQSGRRQITFPRSLALLAWFESQLPARLSARVQRRLRAQIRPDGDFSGND